MPYAVGAVSKYIHLVTRPDSHPELPGDPDVMAARPLHLRPASLAMVFAGGLLGTGARYLIEQAYPFHPPQWPWATFLINLAGAFALGIVLEALARMGDDTGRRQRFRLFFGTGFCGSFTTYSAFALEASLLGRDGDVVVAVAYMATSVILGVVMAWAGIAVATKARVSRSAPRR